MIGISLSFDSLLLWVPVITLLAMFTYGMYFRLFPHKTEEAAFMEEQRKKELTRIVTERKNREITECTEEEKFWELIESTHARGKKAYLSKLRVLRDKLSNQFEPEELIKFDNRYQQLIEEYINQDLVAASTIIFGERNVGLAILLMNIFMFEGEIFFKNACQNPNLIIGKEIERLEMQTIDGHIADLYLRKTNNLIPIYKADEEEFEIPGDKWEERDLPKKFPELWDTFA